MRRDNAAAKTPGDGQQHGDGGARRQGAEVAPQGIVPAISSRLAAGDMVPADVRVLSAKDLFLNQAALTGEALPVEKESRTGAGRRSGIRSICPTSASLGSTWRSGIRDRVVIPHREPEPSL